MLQPHETRRRSIVKAATFRLAVVVAHMFIIYLVTRRFDLAVGLVILTNLASTALYYAHERFWDRISWGRTDDAAGKKGVAPVL